MQNLKMKTATSVQQLVGATILNFELKFCTLNFDF
jgi:hypothetical protein